MHLDFIKNVKAEEYVSPSLDMTAVNAERGFCNSTIEAQNSPFDSNFDPIN